MATIIRCLGYANGAPCNVLEAMLKAYDPEFKHGLGKADWTYDVRRAMKFKDHTAAWELWHKTSKTRPKRPDGQPNRPLTAFNVSFEEEPQ